MALIGMLFRKVWAMILAPVIVATGVTASVVQLAGDDVIFVIPQASAYFDNEALQIGALSDAAPDPDAALAAGFSFVICDVDNATGADLLDTFDEKLGVIAKGYHATAMYDNVCDMGKGWWVDGVDTYKDHPALWGDFIVSQPKAFDKSEDSGEAQNIFANLGEVVNHYYSLTSDRVPFVNLYPLYANSEQLGIGPDFGFLNFQKWLLPWTIYGNPARNQYRQYAAEYIKNVGADTVSVNFFPYEADGTKKVTKYDWLDNLDILATVCRDTNRKLWVVTQAADHGDPATKLRSADKKAEQLQQAYVALAFGAKAVIYDAGGVDWAVETTLVKSVKDVNAELALFADVYGDYDYLGSYLVNERNAAGWKFPLTNGLPDSEKLNLNAGANGLLIGVFAAKDGGGRAYVITNMAEVSANNTARISFTIPAGKTTIVYGAAGNVTYTNGRSIPLSLAPGEGRFITVG